MIFQMMVFLPQYMHIFADKIPLELIGYLVGMVLFLDDRT